MQNNIQPLCRYLQSFFGENTAGMASDDLALPDSPIIVDLSRRHGRHVVRWKNDARPPIPPQKSLIVTADFLNEDYLTAAGTVPDEVKTAIWTKFFDTY